MLKYWLYFISGSPIVQDFNIQKEPFENVCWKYHANKLFGGFLGGGGGLYALQIINPIILKGLFFSN